MAKNKKYNNKKDNFRDKDSKNSKSGKDTRNNSKRSGGNRRDSDYSDRDTGSANSYIGRDNDPAWYNNMNVLIKDVTSIPFGFQVGRELPGSTTTISGPISGSDEPFSSGMNKKAFPGVCALRMHICPGIARSAVDGVNIAAQGLFQNMRRSLSTVASYAPADVMMYVLACDSILSLYSQIVRDFGMINAYSSINLNYNRTIFKSLYSSDSYAEDLIKFQAQYMQIFNNLVYKASTIFIPDMFPIIKRHVWLSSNYFLDAQDPKSQMYIHVLDGVYQLDETTSSQGTMLKYEQFTVVNTMGDLLDKFDTLIEKVRNSDSMLKIAADMARAFPDAKRWTLGYLSGTYVAVPTYSQEVLSQIENTTIVPQLKYPNITQSVDKNTILFQPQVELCVGDESMEPWFLMCGQGDDWNSQFILNMHWTNPSSDDVAVATRDMVVIGSGDAYVPSDHTVVRLPIEACGADICVGVTINKYLANDDRFESFDLHRFNILLDAGYSSDIPGLSAQNLSDYFSFDWAPTIYVGDAVPIQADATGAHKAGMVGKAYRPLLDASNFTFIDSILLTQMHNNIIMSMWSIPQLGEVPKP